VVKVIINSGGAGYTSAPQVSLSGGGGSGATATATFNLTTRTVTGVTITNHGANYTSAPQVAFSGGGGSGASATAELAVGVTAIQAPANLSSLTFSAKPTVTIAGGGGYGATATAQAAAEVVSLTLTNPGSGYTATPAVALSGGGGGGASVSAARGLSIQVTNRGARYTSPPDVGFSGGGLTNDGTHAQATAGIAAEPSTGMQFYYVMREGFFVPELAEQPAVGTILPYLRPSVVPVEHPVTGTPLTITYRPAWPEGAPELQLGETLTLPKFGLPGIYNQTSAQIFYQESVAIAVAGNKPSAILHDPTREKVFFLGKPGGLEKIPESVPTTSYQGRTYFQGLPPHLQDRFFFDPARGTKGALVLLGTFQDVVAGEDYLNLNVLSVADRGIIRNLPRTDSSQPDDPLWIAAVEGLTTTVETFVRDTTKAAGFVAQAEGAPAESAPRVLGPRALAEITHPDSAVDRYALTATGRGDGWVTMVLGNGEAFTPEGEPVSVEVFKVAPRLYTGDLKVNFSSNPLDEQVSLRHSGDFAGRPEDYEFEWRYAPPQDGVAPPVYEYSEVAKDLGRWALVKDPAGARPTDGEYAAAAAAAQEFNLPYAVEIQRWLDRVVIVNGGTNYTSAPSVRFEGGGGSGATATATVDPVSKTVTAVTLTNPGSNYTSAPQILLEGGGGSGAIATAVRRTSGGNLSAGIVAITVVNSGEKYASAPTVALSGGGGSGATAVATINPATGRVLSIQVTNGGAGYTSDPAVTLSGGSGQGATAVAVRGIAQDGFTGGSLRPGLVARSISGVDFTAGVPAKIVFSTALSDPNAGFVLYVNGIAALAFQAPHNFTNSNAATGLVSGGLGLARQFAVGANYFRAGPNKLEVALYTSSDAGLLSSINFQLHAATESDRVIGASPWQRPNGTLTNQEVVGGSATAPLGDPLLVMSDNYFTMRYRPKSSVDSVAPKIGTTADYQWSRWMEPKLVEGWIKRVLAGINPFNQRVGDLFNNAVNTDVSLLTQAGKRWEGNVALNLANINDSGLIEIYETVLNRGKAMSIGNGYDYGPANDALLLAAGYLNDLYTILGNEAFADAANPTISVDDSATATEISTSRFAFEGQVKSVLDEELALLRGRDDFLSPSVATAPAYNRLYWNYTRGINAGEALYAVNYNIREKAGSSTADGKLDAADAQRMFPQAHGDAYGHYLTALKGYSTLLRNPNFTWVPRAEGVTVLGQPVVIDYFDERKFAAAAGNVARTAQQVIALTHRQSYKDDPGAGWSHFRDGKTNSRTNTKRHWGVDEWTSRATQGAYYHWLVGNAILPDKDLDPTHNGVQIVDRTTVPELRELPVLATDFQAKIDAANAHLNPLGLSPAAIAFDISPAELKAGKSHYDQIHERALRATLNAKGAFDQAARMTRLLRNQENQLGDYNSAIVDQESAFEGQLIELYGTPYAGHIGAGKTYAQGYTGPDLLEWSLVDRPTDIVGSASAVTIKVPMPTNVDSFRDLAPVSQTVSGLREPIFNDREITIESTPYVQFSSSAMGRRATTGALQQALLDAYQAEIALRHGHDTLVHKHALVKRRHELAATMVLAHAASVEAEKIAGDEMESLAKTQYQMQILGESLDLAGEALVGTGDIIKEAFPKVLGLSNDGTSTIRSVIWSAAHLIGFGLKAGGLSQTLMAQEYPLRIAAQQRSLDQLLAELSFTYEQAQTIYEYEELLREFSGGFAEVGQLALTLQRANEQVRNLIAQGEGIQADREVFRQRAAAIIQGYRTKDLTFRTFRNEALEQYRSLFDLAGRYTYLAAKSYDYETGLLGSADGQAVINGIVAARALGDLTGGTPQATVSTLGDAGLAGTMARMQADWAVAKGRLGINNPDQNGTVFSLRRELFRHLDGTDGDTLWRQTLEQHIMSNVMADADVAAACRNLRKADGSAVPGIVIPFSTFIGKGQNFFGRDLAVGDHTFSDSNYATKIYSVGVVLRGYVGMDAYATGTLNAAGPNTTAPNGLSATPYVYLIPTGTDYMLAPPLGDTGAARSFTVHDQALPLPFNLGATAFSTTQFFNANGTLSEAPWILRKHQAFRPVSDPAFFYSSVPADFTNSRLVGRSVWNSGWKIVIPAFTLLNNEQEGLNRFAASVKDIELFLRTYSHSGN
jgi:hypothetical protein